MKISISKNKINFEVKDIKEDIMFVDLSATSLKELSKQMILADNEIEITIEDENDDNQIAIKKLLVDIVSKIREISINNSTPN